MKIKLIVMAMALFVGLVGVSGAQASVTFNPYFGAWTPNSDDVHFIRSEPKATTPFTFFLTDTGDGGNKLFLTLSPMDALSVAFNFDTHQFTYDDGNEGTPNQTLVLSNNNHFYIGYGEGNSYLFSYGVYEAYQKDIYFLKFDDSVNISMADVHPVPIPGAALLLGSGLLVLLGVRKKYAA